SPGRFTVIFPKDSKPNSQKITFLEKEFKKKNSGYFLYHIVKRGDSLWKIASRYKTSVSKIKALNNLSSNVIRPGQKLRLKGKVPRKSKTYIVRSGDTLWDIANKHKTSIKKLMKINSLHSSNIRPGQKLRIY
ncbi:MAG: LysM peptidoglycan-binding domain-containing protein, partial [Candidatus Cloacimonadota bacterium]|nr:LysM peptidoglycan-binding domain-containing protein [Candidatus Cloacimonadota bacterium]